MALPTVFGEQSSPLANYDYYEISEGTGIVNFYGACASTAAATYDYFLTNNSGVISAKGGQEELNQGGDLTLTFSVPFNLPKYITGNAFVSVPLSLTTSGSAAGRTAYTTITISHYDGSTDTPISSAIQSENFTVGGYNAALYKTLTTKLVLTPKQFGKGDVLRIKVVTTMTSGGGTAGGQIAYSPSNQVTGWTNSRLFALIPFRIDL